MHKIQKQRTDTGGEGYTLTLDRLTKGELIAITRSLKFYDSPVSKDVLAFIRNAIHESRIEDLKRDVEDCLKVGQIHIRYSGIQDENSP